MKNIYNILQTHKNKIAIGVFLFCYFGFIAIPKLTRPYLSVQLCLWALVFPFIVISLVINGIRAGIELWRERKQNAIPNTNNKYQVWLSIFCIIWFFISITLAKTTYSAYSHIKFDRETWINADELEGGMFQISTRERMLDDLQTNVIPGRSKEDILYLLGEPYELSYDYEMTGKYAGLDLFIYFYKMGMVDPVCLTIVFDKNDIAIDTLTSECG